MTRVLRYILLHDTGMAPCVDGGLISLATCKPKIRASAEPGDWVVGFRPRPAARGLVIWAARVAHAVGVGDYERQYRGRSDAIYRARSGGGFSRLRPDYHAREDDMRKDTSAPVLVFDPCASWYFGRAPHLLPESLMHLAASGRGHRVSGSSDADVVALQTWLAGIGPPMVHAPPGAPASRRRRDC